MRQLSSSAPYSVLAEAAEKLEATRLELNNEEVRTEALKVLHDTVEQSRSEAFAYIPEEVGETATSIQLDELSAILTVTVTVRLPRSVPAKHGHPEKISTHFPPPRRHSGVAKDAKD